MIENVLPTNDALTKTGPTLPQASRPFEVPFEELDPVSARQAILASLGQKLITATDISMLALDAAKMAAKTCDVDCYSVAEKSPGRDSLPFSFGRFDPESARTIVDEHELASIDQDSLTGYALNLAQPVVVVDLDEDTRYADQLLREYEIKSAVVCPLMHPNGPLGTLGVYSRKQHGFSSADVYFLESVANLVAISFARRSAEEMVSIQSKRLEVLIESTDTPTMELTPDGRISHCNPSLEQISGFALAEIEGRSIYSAFVLPEELDNVTSALSVAVKNRECSRRECYLLTKTGARRRMIWSFTGVVDDNDEVTSVVGTGIDITEQHELNERVKRAEAMADNAVQSLRAMRSKAANTSNSDSFRSGFAGTPPERRRNERRPFPFKQILAPVVGGQMPSHDAFREVRCYDLSAQGFSFLVSEIPDYQQLVIAFGKQGGLIYITAEIIHISPTTFEGEELLLIGCRYTGRTSHPYH